MESVLDIIYQTYNSNDISKCIEGLELSATIINEITGISVKLLEEKKYDMFLITERISSFFDDYLKKLIKMLNSEDKDLSFWSASLIVHYNINNQQAEIILLNEVKNGKLERAQIATTILNRNKNPLLIEALETRLKQKEPEKKNQLFFEEKLGSLKDFQERSRIS